MKVSSTQNTGSTGVASSGSPPAQTGEADASFASLLGVDDGDRDETPPAKDRTGTKDDPGHKDVRNRDRKGSSSSSPSQMALTTNLQRNPANVNELLLTAPIAPVANGSVDIPAGISSAVSGSLGQAPRAPTLAGGSETAIGSNGKAALERVATPDDAIETDKSGGLFALPAMDETGNSVESSSRPTTTTLDKDVAAASADAANGAAKNNRVEVNAQIAAATQSTMQPATGAVFQSSQNVSQIIHVDSVNPAKGSGVVEGVQAGTIAGVVSSGIETSANSTVVTSIKMVTTEKASREQLSGADPQNVVASSVAASGGNQLAGSGGEAHGDTPEGGANSSGFGESAQQTPPSKNVLTAADLTQVGRGQAAAAPAAREGAASSANTNFPAAHSAMPPISQVDVARVLQSAMRGDVRVGVQTEAFGRVTIQTVAANGQLSAQLSLENAKQSAALALHLPAVEERLTQRYGLNASVNLAGTSSRDAGGMTNGGRGSNPNNNDHQNGGNSATARMEGFNPFSPAMSGAAAIRSVSPRSSLSQRLDIIV